MLLSEYLSDVAAVLSNYSRIELILSSELKIDARTEKIGLIKCAITFVDESKLLLTEYLDLRYKIEKLGYSFHYQDKDGNLIFRYDNAAHKPSLNFVDHKHTKSGAILQSEIPILRNILEEIVSEYLKTIK